ncbi:MAG: Lsm family RNA-binding protein [Candidatus Hodarchaeales archaeon]|jgi:small nuclear ribonucleoprotein (snRNP)-like protein
MSVANAKRNFARELLSFLNKRVSLVLISGTKYTGELRGIDTESGTAILAKANRSSDEREFHKIYVAGSQIVELFLEEAPFDLSGLALELEKVFRRPGDVKLYKDAGLIVVLERVRVSETGVEGTGPVADRVKHIWEQYVSRPQAEEEED